MLSRIDPFHVMPQTNVHQIGGVLGLPQIGKTGEEGNLPVSIHDQTLKHAETEGVVTGQVIHGLLFEHEQTVQSSSPQSRGCIVSAAAHFSVAEMNRHNGFLVTFDQAKDH